jgi:hypothetical protein
VEYCCVEPFRKSITAHAEQIRQFHRAEH